MKRCLNKNYYLLISLSAIHINHGRFEKIICREFARKNNESLR